MQTFLFILTELTVKGKACFCFWSGYKCAVQQAGFAWIKSPPVPCSPQPSNPWAVRRHIMPRLTCGCRQVSLRARFLRVLRCCKQVFWAEMLLCPCSGVSQAPAVSPCSPCPLQGHWGKAAAWVRQVLLTAVSLPSWVPSLSSAEA